MSYKKLTESGTSSEDENLVTNDELAYLFGHKEQEAQRQEEASLPHSLVIDDEKGKNSNYSRCSVCGNYDQVVPHVPCKPEYELCTTCRKPFIKKNDRHQYCSRDCARPYFIVRQGLSFVIRSFWPSHH